MDYEKQAIDFLARTNVSMKAEEAVPQVSPRWAKDGRHGLQWSIELHKGDINGKTIQFFFWDSIYKKQKIDNLNARSLHKMKYKAPTAYDVLAGIYHPIESFKDFCDSFGYDSDSKSAEATYNEVVELNEKLASIFTISELESLAEIQ